VCCGKVRSGRLHRLRFVGQNVGRFGAGWSLRGVPLAESVLKSAQGFVTQAFRQAVVEPVETLCFWLRLLSWATSVLELEGFLLCRRVGRSRFLVLEKLCWVCNNNLVRLAGSSFLPWSLVFGECA